WIVDGKVYLLEAGQGAAAARALWVSTLKTQADAVSGARPLLEPTRLAQEAVDTWSLPVAVHDITLPRGPLGAPVRLAVAQVAHLAYAQWVVDQQLRPVMDMSLCGDAVNQLTTWWLPQITGAGYAVLASAAGIRLDGPLAQLAARPVLPPQLTIEDFRVQKRV
ncbi:MAG: hypothetical protein ACRCV9_08670, partial [Burkholderiaceae bacterium]